MNPPLCQEIGVECVVRDQLLRSNDTFGHQHSIWDRRVTSEIARNCKKSALKNQFDFLVLLPHCLGNVIHTKFCLLKRLNPNSYTVLIGQKDEKATVVILRAILSFILKKTS